MLPLFLLVTFSSLRQWTNSYPCPLRLSLTHRNLGPQNEALPVFYPPQCLFLLHLTALQDFNSCELFANLVNPAWFAVSVV